MKAFFLNTLCDIKDFPVANAKTSANTSYYAFQGLSFT
jgi:hypothetical protein